jgi:hypothetical protein
MRGLMPNCFLRSAERLNMGAIGGAKVDGRMSEERETVAILQTGRLGDLWYTLPLCHHLYSQGHEVEVVYDAQFGNPFTFAPYVKPRPIAVQRRFPRDKGWGHFWNEAVIQLRWLRMLRREGRRVVWNQVFPFHWPQAVLRRVPYPVYWYRKYPEIDFRKAVTTLDVRQGDRLLVFRHSQSLKLAEDTSYYEWIDRNLTLIANATGLRPLLVAYGDQPDHKQYDTWRGSLDEYENLVAGCGMVFGISTSAHVLGQLLGKPVVALYDNRQRIVDTIGAESGCLCFSQHLTKEQLKKLGGG